MRALSRFGFYELRHGLPALFQSHFKVGYGGHVKSLLFHEVNTDLVSYYNHRAWEYEKVYSKPERQLDLQDATSILQQRFRDKSVLEIACGTGYWTQRLAKTAKDILATDINEAVLHVAKIKMYAPAAVRFQVADLFTFQSPTRYEGLFGGFIWSHIPLQLLDSFLETVNQHVIPGGTIVFMDNTYVAGSNLPLSHQDEYGNTYQIRQLEGGATYAVLKNFPEEAVITSRLRAIAAEITFIRLNYFWIVACKNT